MGARTSTAIGRMFTTNGGTKPSLGFVVLNGNKLNQIDWLLYIVINECGVGRVDLEIENGIYRFAHIVPHWGVYPPTLPQDETELARRYFACRSDQLHVLDLAQAMWIDQLLGRVTQIGFGMLSLVVADGKYVGIDQDISFRTIR